MGLPGRSRALGLASAIVLLQAAAAARAPAHSGPLLTGAGTATIDGTFSPGEWDGAGSASFQAQVIAGTSSTHVPATVYVMNDRRTLYIALRVPYPTREGTRVDIAFDGDHNGTATPASDDAMFLDNGWGRTASNESFIDTWWCEPRSTCDDITNNGGTRDGAGTARTSDGMTTYELSKPLRGDSRDLNVSPGQTIGFQLSYATENNNDTRYWAGADYPPGSDWSSFGTFGEILIAQPPPPARPQISGVQAIDVTRTSAALRALVAPGEVDAAVHFEWGRDPSYGTSSAPQTVPVTVSSATVRAELAGLQPGTTYHFRTVATNEGGTVYGPDQTLQTLADLAPVVRAAPVRVRAGTRAVLRFVVHDDTGEARAVVRVLRGRRLVATSALPFASPGPRTAIWRGAARLRLPVLRQRVRPRRPGQRRGVRRDHCPLGSTCVLSRLL